MTAKQKTLFWFFAGWKPQLFLVKSIHSFFQKESPFWLVDIHWIPYSIILSLRKKHVPPFHPFKKRPATPAKSNQVAASAQLRMAAVSCPTWPPETFTMEGFQSSKIHGLLIYIYMNKRRLISKIIQSSNHSILFNHPKSKSNHPYI